MSKVWTAKDVEYLQVIAQDVISLNTLIGNPEEGEECELSDFIEDTSPSFEELIISNSTRKFLLQIIETILSPREEKIIKLRYGFETGHPMTLDAIGRQFGVTRERIRQIEESAINKIREKLARMNLGKEDL